MSSNALTSTLPAVPSAAPSSRDGYAVFLLGAQCFLVEALGAALTTCGRRLSLARLHVPEWTDALPVGLVGLFAVVGYVAVARGRGRLSLTRVVFGGMALALLVALGALFAASAGHVAALTILRVLGFLVGTIGATHARSFAIDVASEGAAPRSMLAGVVAVSLPAALVGQTTARALAATSATPWVLGAGIVVMLGAFGIAAQADAVVRRGRGEIVPAKPAPRGYLPLLTLVVLMSGLLAPIDTLREASIAVAEAWKASYPGYAWFSVAGALLGQVALARWVFARRRLRVAVVLAGGLELATWGFVIVVAPALTMSIAFETQWFAQATLVQTITYILWLAMPPTSRYGTRLAVFVGGGVVTYVIEAVLVAFLSSNLATYSIAMLVVIAAWIAVAAIAASRCDDAARAGP